MPRRVPDWSSLVIFAIGLSCVGHIGIVAQTSTAVCLSSFGWMDNSKGQNPCLVSAYLQGACNGGQFTVDPLPVNTHYIGPYADQANECQCSSVTYNTISACGICQNRTIIGWSSWDFNCTAVYAGVFPLGIPNGTAVPVWAFQDVTTSDLFNATLAQIVGDSPEATPSSVQSTSSVSAGSTSSTSPTSSPSTSSVSSSSSNAGAIAGGVVGGVVGVALIAGAVILFVLKKRSRIPPSALPASYPTSSVHPSGHTDITHVAPQMMAQTKVYDPSDPSTFPMSLPPTNAMSASLSDVRSPTYSTSSMRPGYYSGAPEI